MAKSKSPGAKPNRTRANKEQTNNGNSADAAEVKATATEATLVDATPKVEPTPAPAQPLARSVSLPDSTTAAEANSVRASEASPLGEARVSPEPRRMEVVKNEPRRNVVPINLDDEIRRRAYELYQQRGAAPGNQAEDWLNAEREVRQRYRQHSA
jgi:Protein of unknown function (DUF2934)